MATFVFFDIETTGLDLAVDQLIEVAGVRVCAGKVDGVFSSLVCPTVGIAHTSSDIHGIPVEALTQAPRWGEIEPSVRLLFADAVLVGHGTDVDVGMLSRAFGDGTFPAHVLDTLTLARRAIASRRYTLSALTELLELPTRAWHRAAEDAAGTRALFDAVAPMFAPASARDLWEVRVGQRGPVVVRTAIAAKLRDAATRGGRVRVVLRSRARPAEALVGVVEHWEHPRARLALAAGGVRIVRADRILRVEDV